MRRSPAILCSCILVIKGQVQNSRFNLNENIKLGA